MARNKFIYLANSASDAAYINVDRIHDIEVNSATEVIINYKLNDNADGTTALVVTTGKAAQVVKDLAALITTGQDQVITVADDVNSIYMANVTGTGAVGHS